MKRTPPLLALLMLSLFSLTAQTRLIWTTFGQGRFNTCLPDGSGFQELFTFDGSSSGFVLDPENMLLYWANGARGQIMRTDYTFQSIDTLVSGLDRPQQIALDKANGKLYWSDGDQDHIQRADLDGGNREIIYQDIALNPAALFMDPTSQYLYFSRNSGLIGKIDVTSLEVEPIVMVPGMPTEIEVDPDQMKLYWSGQGFDESKIQRCNLDGSNVEDLVTGLERTYGIALDLDEGKIYWTVWGGSFPKIIRRANLDGTEVEDVIEINGTSPYALSLADNLTVSADFPIHTREDEFVLFPNPTNGQLRIKGDATRIDTGRILDGEGREVARWSGSVTELDLGHLPAGVYYVSIRTGKSGWSERIVKY